MSKIVLDDSKQIALLGLLEESGNFEFDLIPDDEGNAYLVKSNKLAINPAIPAILSGGDVQFYINYYLENDIVSGVKYWSGFGHVRLTLNGHERLRELRKNTPFRRFVNWVTNFVGRTTETVAVPVLVTVLTLFVLKYLGID